MRVCLCSWLGALCAVSAWSTAASAQGLTPSSEMGGTTNVQGRLINAVAADKVCGTNATASSGRFIHIEQQPGYRDAKDWIAALVSAFPK